MGYADDAALLDMSPDIAAARVTAIAQGSAADADMLINVSKTKCMHVCRQGACPRVTDVEARAKAKFTCPHVNCNFVFFNKHGLKVHAGKCPNREVYIADKILAVTGDTGSPETDVSKFVGRGRNDKTTPTNPVHRFPRHSRFRYSTLVLHIYIYIT